MNTASKCARCRELTVNQINVELMGWLCEHCYADLQETRRKVREFEAEEFRKFNLGPKGKT
jgi:hypothetical protein